MFQRSPGLFTSLSGKKRKTDQKWDLFMSRHFRMNKHHYGEIHICMKGKFLYDCIHTGQNSSPCLNLSKGLCIALTSPNANKYNRLVWLFLAGMQSLENLKLLRVSVRIKEGNEVKAFRQKNRNHNYMKILFSVVFCCYIYLPLCYTLPLMSKQ